MKTIKFISTDQKQKEFARVLRKNVNDYFIENSISKKGNWIMVVKSAMMLTMFLLPLVLILIIPMNFWLVLLLYMVMGAGKAGVGMGVMHDAIHGSYSEKEWVNKLMSNTMYILGANVFNWEVCHNMLHHVYTNINGIDGDIESRGPIRFSEHAPLKKVHRYQYIHAFFIYGLVTLFKFGNDVIQLFQFNKNGIMEKKGTYLGKELAKVTLVKVIYLLVMIGLPILLTDLPWWQVAAGFFFMHITAGFILGIVFQLAHVVEDVDQPKEKESGLIENDWLVHEIHTTCNFARNNSLLNWYIGGLNYQIEHHLFPNICHIHYPKISPIVERTIKEFGYPYHEKPTFRSAIASHMRKLKELGRPVAPAPQRV